MVFLSRTLLALVLGFFNGLVTERIAMKHYLNSFIGATTWNFCTKLFFSFQVLLVMLWSLCDLGGKNLLEVATCFVDNSDDKLDMLNLQYFILMLIVFGMAARVGAALQPVGLTGGIACGKSTVSEELGKYAFTIIDVDTIAHDILEPYKMGYDSVYDAVVDEFGDEILEERPAKGAAPKIDRKKLGAIVFGDNVKRQKLNALTHPRIIWIMLKRIVHESLKGDPKKVVCVDIPLLFEGGFPMTMLFGLKIVVACLPSLQLKRLEKRNPELTKNQCQERMASQYPITQKVAMADLVIYNNGTMETLKEDVNRIRWETIRRKKGNNMGFDQVVVLQGFFLISLNMLRVIYT